jgi:hypothetical protein
MGSCLRVAVGRAIHTSAATMSYNVQRWWSRVGQIRNAMDQGRTFHEAQALSMERAVAEIVDDACSPWFDERAFYTAASCEGEKNG